jgi:hypothetical protein
MVLGHTPIDAFALEVTTLRRHDSVAYVYQEVT